MTEMQFSKRLCRQLEAVGWDVQRIEDKLTPGIPDINICRLGVELWIETKVFKWPKRESTVCKVGLRPEQVGWARTRTRHGGRVLLCAMEVETEKVLTFQWADMIDIDINPLNRTQVELKDLAAHTGALSELVLLLCALAEQMAGVPEKTDKSIIIH